MMMTMMMMMMFSQLSFTLFPRAALPAILLPLPPAFIFRSFLKCAEVLPRSSHEHKHVREGLF